MGEIAKAAGGDENVVHEDGHLKIAEIGDGAVRIEVGEVAVDRDRFRVDGDGHRNIAQQIAACGQDGKGAGRSQRKHKHQRHRQRKQAGLFGKINGGRVSGVQVKDGYVTGDPADSGLEDVGVGGLAGKIDSKSLVDGCRFVGEVWNTSSVNTGGFVGYTADAPVILRCCVESYVANESSKIGRAPV